MDDIVMTRAADPPPVARADGVTLWRQIAGMLESEIASGALPPAAQLPPEAALAARFGVNRHTVRRALEELSRSGLIRIEQGRGSFVAEDVLDYSVGPRTRFSEWVRRHNREPSGKILALGELAAAASVAGGLGLDAGARVVLYRRLGMADGRPVCLAEHYFSPDRLRGIEAALRATDSITAALREVGVADYRRLSTKVSARLPTPEEAELLRTGRNRPVLTCENTNVDGAGTVVEYCHARYPTPRVQIIFEP